MTEALVVSLPERTNLYINNINSQTKNQIEVLIRDGVISCRNDEDFYISVISFNTLYSFYQVIDGFNNKFNVVHRGIRTSYSIPDGNISVDTIIDYFNSIKVQTDIIISYDKIKNKFNFKKQSQNHSVVLELVNCHSLLGFRNTESSITLPATHLSVSSAIPINVSSITNLFIHLDAGYDLPINDNNFDNHNLLDKTIKSNNIVCAIPIRKCYNGVISYNNNDATTSFNFKCNRQENIQSSRLSIKDQYDREVPIGDYYIILQLTKKLKSHPIILILNELKDYLLKILLLISSFFV